MAEIFMACVLFHFILTSSAVNVFLIVLHVIRIKLLCSYGNCRFTAGSFL